MFGTEGHGLGTNHVYGGDDDRNRSRQNHRIHRKRRLRRPGRPTSDVSGGSTWRRRRLRGGGGLYDNNSEVQATDEESATSSNGQPLLSRLFDDDQEDMPSNDLLVSDANWSLTKGFLHFTGYYPTRLSTVYDWSAGRNHGDDDKEIYSIGHRIERRSDDSDRLGGLSWERKFHRLRCLIEEQENVLMRQSRRLEQFERQIEDYETMAHSRRVSEDGPNYIYLAYDIVNSADDNEDIRRHVGTNNNAEPQETEHINNRAPSGKVSAALLSTDARTIASEADELKGEIELLAAISDSQNLQLVDFSRRIDKYDEHLVKKRLIYDRLEKQVVEFCQTNREKQSSGENSSASAGSSADDGRTKLDSKLDICRITRGVDDDNSNSKLFVTLDSDTGLSSMDSESPVELSPV